MPLLPSLIDQVRLFSLKRYVQFLEKNGTAVQV
jgi:hypothetical protein